MSDVAIIGAGLAGLACARALKMSGLSCVIYESADHIGAGASGNDVGMVNPRFTAERTPESAYFSSAFAMAVKLFDVWAHDIAWNRCGALHLINDEKRKKRYMQTAKNWGWHEDHMRILKAQEASDVADIDLTCEALYLRDAGCLSPLKLCEFLARHQDIQFKTKIENLNDIKQDIIIIANGANAKFYPETAALAIKPVRGQITKIQENEISKSLKANIHYGGYLSVSENGYHCVGATFQPWLNTTEIMPQDDQDNIQKMIDHIPALAGAYEIKGCRASIRATSPHHFPIVGQMPHTKNLFLSTAHGSHGIISALMAAEVLTDLILQRPLCLPRETINSLSPQRSL